MPVVHTDGRAYGHVIIKFFRLGLDYHIFLPMVLRCAPFALEISANNKSIRCLFSIPTSSFHSVNCHLRPVANTCLAFATYNN